MNTLKNLKIKLPHVMRVYSGKPGCLGNYRVAQQHLIIANQTRGYPHDASDVNDRQVRRVVKILQHASNGFPLDAVARFDAQEEYIYAEVNGRAYAAYFVPAVQP